MSSIFLAGGPKRGRDIFMHVYMYTCVDVYLARTQTYIYIYDMLCVAILCYDMILYVTMWYDMLCYVMPCSDMLCYDMLMLTQM